MFSVLSKLLNADSCRPTVLHCKAAEGSVDYHDKPLMLSSCSSRLFVSQCVSDQDFDKSLQAFFKKRCSIIDYC